MVDHKLEGQALKRYKVRILIVGEKHFTIYAHTPADAERLVREGHGRPAGEVSPQVMGAEVAEMGVIIPGSASGEVPVVLVKP